MEGHAHDHRGQDEGHRDDRPQHPGPEEAAPVEHQGTGHAQHHAQGGGGGRLEEGLADDAPGALAREDLPEAGDVQGAVDQQAAGQQGGHRPGEEQGEEDHGQGHRQGPAAPLGPAGARAPRPAPAHEPAAWVQACSHASRLAVMSAAETSMGASAKGPNLSSSVGRAALPSTGYMYIWPGMSS